MNECRLFSDVNTFDLKSVNLDVTVGYHLFLPFNSV